MLSKLLKYGLLYIVLIVFVNHNAFSQSRIVTKEKVLETLNGGARHAIDVLLDDDYKSRCDYNITEGKWYDYEIPWHTGQIIYGLLEAYKVTGNEEYLDAAQKAGDWWSSLLITDHPKLNGMIKASHGDHAGENLVFATVTDGSAGMFLLHDITGVKKYADVPTSAGDWMLRHMYIPDYKLFYDVIDPVSGEVMKENSPFWPDKKEQKLFDVARPNNEGSIFMDMYEYTGNEEYKKMFITLCESLLEYQGPEGVWMDFMPNDKASGSLHPRFNLWYAESLLEGYDLTGDKRYLDAAKKTLKLYQSFQKNDGTIYYKNYLDGSSNQNSVCGSAVSFAGMLWIRLAGYGVGEEFKENIEKSAEWVIKNRFSDNHPDKNLQGAFLNLRTRRKKGKIWMTQRDVGTSFGMRFMAAYHDYKFK